MLTPKIILYQHKTYPGIDLLQLLCKVPRASGSESRGAPDVGKAVGGLRIVHPGIWEKLPGYMGSAGF